MNTPVQAPVFAVVGHPNKGKSSVVATLSQDESVVISPLSGTTSHSTSYPMSVDGRMLYCLVDTPGFQRARAAMAWMQARTRSVADRREIVSEFLQKNRDNPQFSAECELLTPIMQGAGILYVVDGSLPYADEYDAEMEILRWSGQPSMALINPIGQSDHLGEWKNALSQYFQIVRVFNATTADHERRQQLLRGFSELNDEWHAHLTEAICVLETQRDDRRRQTAGIIAGMISQMVTHSLESPLDDECDQQKRDSITFSFLTDLRSIESDCRARVEQIYGYRRLNRDEVSLSFEQKDLFSSETWRVMGLSNDQLVATATVGGAATGGMVDVATGGASMLLGSGIGALVGGLSAWFGREKLARTRIKGNDLGQKLLVTRPIGNRNFPYVLLDRALLHHRLVEARTHARQDLLAVNANGVPSRQLDNELRNRLEKIFNRLRKARQMRPALDAELADQVYQLINTNL